MSDLCYMQPCSNETLDAAAQTIIAGCSSDLEKDGLSDSVVTEAFGAYPLVREILCTKTYVVFRDSNNRTDISGMTHTHQSHTVASLAHHLSPSIAVYTTVPKDTFASPRFSPSSLLTLVPSPLSPTSPRL